MTKNKKEKKDTKRSREKYPDLKKEFHPRTRKDYIETDYINGVFDSHGREVIRPLTADEKEWHNKFYAEYYGASFAVNKKYSDLKKELNRLKRKQAKQGLHPQEIKKFDHILIQMYELSEDKLLHEDPFDQWELGGDNNSRNRCAFNLANGFGGLEELTDEVYEQLHNDMYRDPERANELIIKEMDQRLCTE